MNVKIIVILSVVLSFASCVKEPTRVGYVVEGEPTRINLKMSMAKMGSDPTITKAMTPEQEKEIDNIRVMIFNNQGTIVNNEYFTGPAAKTTLSINTISGEGKTICIVANAVEAVNDRLSKAVSKDETIKAITTDAELSFGLEENKPLMMTDVLENVTISQDNKTPLIKSTLIFMSAKLTLTVKDATNKDASKGDVENVEILGFDVINAPRNIYIFSNTKDYTPDPTVPENDKDEYWFSSQEQYGFLPGDEPKKQTITLYMMENRRGNRVAHISRPDDDPNYSYKGTIDDGKHEGKAWFAPKRATYILIYAIHKKTSNVTGVVDEKQIKAKIYIGDDNNSNYDIKRGSHYSFNVTVNGMDKIDIDSNVSYTAGNVEILYSAENMDAHADYRPMRIKAPKGKMKMEILDENGLPHSQPGFKATWLKISPLDIMRHQVKQNGNIWQQEATADNTFVRAKYIPNKKFRETYTGNKWWNDPSYAPFEDKDSVMTYAKATQRMCYSITAIPFDATAGNVEEKTMFLYAEEFLSNEGTRSAKVRFSFYKEGTNTDGPPDYISVFNVRQDGYFTFFTDDPNAGLVAINTDGTMGSGKPIKFAIEQYEEIAMELDLDYPNPPGVTQWGFTGMTLYEGGDAFRNGYFMTANAVYKDVNRSNNEPVGFGRQYQDMYGRGKMGYIGKDEVLLDNTPINTYSGKTTNAPYYYPVVGASAYHPIYNSSAARYCHEKNRDENGDGIIDENETHWYMPSIDELMLIWIADGEKFKFINFMSFSHYWSITEAPPVLIAEKMVYDKYLANFISNYMATNGNVDRYGVRCIRRL